MRQSVASMRDALHKLIDAESEVCDREHDLLKACGWIDLDNGRWRAPGGASEFPISTALSFVRKDVAAKKETS